MKYPIRVGDVVRIQSYMGAGANVFNRTMGVVLHTNTPANTYMVGKFEGFDGSSINVCREQMTLYSKSKYTPKCFQFTI